MTDRLTSTAGGTLEQLRQAFLDRGWPAADLERFQMMAGFISSLEASILDHVLNDGTYTPPTNWFIGVSTTTPTETGGNFTEPVGNAYARVSTAAADWAAAAAGDPSTKANGNAITFPSATGAWGTLTHVGFFTASSGGTVQIWAPLAVSKVPTSGDTLSFGVGAIVVELGDPGDTY